MAKESKVSENKKNKKEKSNEPEIIKVSEVSLAHVRNETVPGVHVGKKPKFGKNKFGE